MPRSRATVHPFSQRITGEASMTAAKGALRESYGLTGETLDALVSSILAQGIDVEVRIGVKDAHRKEGRVRVFAGYSKRIA